MNGLFHTRLRPPGVIMLVLIVASCARITGVPTRPPLKATYSPTTEATSLTPDFTSALSGARPVWKTTDSWPPANQIRVMLMDQTHSLWAGGPGGLISWNLNTNQPTIYVNSDKPDKTNIVALAQTVDLKLWVGTFGNGMSVFDGKDWQSFTTREGLPGNYILGLVSAQDGGLWVDLQKMEYRYDPGQEVHFGQFDGSHWVPKIGGGFSWIRELPDGSILGARGDTGLAKRDSLIGIYDGHGWKDLGLNRQTITAVTVAPDGLIWVATTDGIFRYDKNAWLKTMPPWSRKNSASVASIAVAEDGTAWFGLSYGSSMFPGTCGIRMDYTGELGVYRYNGQNWTQFTTNDGLIDNKICAITLDLSGNVWLGSFDKGISRFDGHNWASYVVP
jgi:ligand-binding sensor domain-containing protein